MLGLFVFTDMLIASMCAFMLIVSPANVNAQTFGCLNFSLDLSFIFCFIVQFIYAICSYDNFIGYTL